MIGWLLLSALLAVLLVLGTLAWWRVGDYWADHEHKRFKGKPASEAHDHQAPRVIAPFQQPADHNPRD